MQKTQTNTSPDLPKIDEMFMAGVHYGYGKSRRHPTVASYIYATKNGSDIIDLEKTSDMLSEASEFLKSLGSRNKTVLFVGTKPEAKETVKRIAESLNMPYVTERWIGGTLSNFGEIKKRINVLETYQKESVAGELNKYTKKERLMMAKEMEKLAKYYTGLLGLKKAPDALFVVDARKEHIAATEARDGGIPVVALINSDSDIKGIDFPVIGNDASIPSIRLVCEAMSKAYKAGQMSVAPKE